MFDHVVVFNKRPCTITCKAFCGYYHRTRTHLALQEDSPEPRSVQPPEAGAIISIALGGNLVDS
jgi:hypothetical protein